MSMCRIHVALRVQRLPAGHADRHPAAPVLGRAATLIQEEGGPGWWWAGGGAGDRGYDRQTAQRSHRQGGVWHLKF